MNSNNIFLKIILFPFSFLYGLIISARNLLFDLNILNSTEFNIPIISIGNITVGGTGKTPHTEYLIKLLKNDYHLATLSRGYKRKSKGFILSDENSTSEQIGDEPMQIKRKFSSIEVAVDGDRVAGVKKILKSKNGDKLDAILLDDAYQHRYIKTGLSILLIDYNRPITKDKIMPSGRLRESANEKSRANIIIVSKSPVNMHPIERRIMVKELDLAPYQSLYFTYLAYGAITKVYQDANDISADKLIENNTSILMVTGIANPEPFKIHIETISNNVSQLKYPDHYAFSIKDIAKIEKEYKKLGDKDAIIICTEKDAVRLFDMNIENENLRNNLYYIPLEIDFLNDDKGDFDKKIINYINRNTRHSNLHNNKDN